MYGHRLFFTLFIILSSVLVASDAFARSDLEKAIRDVERYAIPDKELKGKTLGPGLESGNFGDDAKGLCVCAGTHLTENRNKVGVLVYSLGSVNGSAAEAVELHCKVVGFQNGRRNFASECANWAPLTK